MFSIRSHSEFSLALGQQLGGEEGCGCLKSEKGWLDHNRRANRSEEEIFYLHRSQPFEKAQFGKINASKCKLFY
jgi:hypothetical protein